MALLRRFKALFGSNKLHDELAEELRSHIEMRTADNIAAGMSPSDARRDAVIRFGNAASIAEDTRRFDSIAWLESAWSDVRYGLRSLARNPLLVAVIVLSLGLGIGANTTIFSLFRFLLLDDVSASEPQQAYFVEFHNSNRTSYPNWSDLERSHALAGLAAFTTTNLTWRDHGSSDTVFAQIASPNFFDVLGSGVASGHAFSAAEASSSGGSVAVVSDWFRRERLGGGEVIGRTLLLNDRAFTIVGVLPRGFRSVMLHGLVPEVVVPASPAVLPSIDDRAAVHIALLGRAWPGMSEAQARSALEAQGRRIESLYPRDAEGLGRPILISLQPWKRLHHLEGDLTVFFSVLFVMVGIVFLVACANIANLLSARALNRTHEIAVRLSLGASRMRIVRQLLTETAALAVFASLVGVLITTWTTHLVSIYRPSGLLPDELRVMHPQFQFDFGLAAFAAALALLAIFFCGVAPALRATGAPAFTGLKQTSPAIARARTRGGVAVVVVQVAAAAVLSITAMLFLRSLARSARSDPGFDVAHLAVVEAHSAQADGDAAHSQRLKLLLSERLRVMPGVDGVATVAVVPLSGSGNYSDGIGVENGTQRIEHALNSVGAGYFHTMHIPVLRGREFNAGDRSGSAPVVMVNDAFARRYLAGRDPVGAILLHLHDRQTDKLELIGVVADTPYARMGEEIRPAVYYCDEQQPVRELPSFVVHFADNVAAPLAVEQAVASPAESLSIHASAMNEFVALALLPQRLASLVLTLIGGLGLGLATAGVYGLMTYIVNRRLPEIGIRMALGAAPRDVLRMVLTQGMSMVWIGLAIGAALSAAASRILKAFLAAGLSGTDATSFAAVFVLLSGCGLAASTIPALRAMAADPVQALRSE